MLKAHAVFLSNLQTCREQTALHDFLKMSITSPLGFDDLLRFQLVYAVSSFDKLLHDIIRVGMVESLIGTRVPTAKFKAEAITIEFHATLVSSTLPPAQILFDQEVVRRLRLLSFQDPDKVADGLSLIWA